jgi:DNA-binding NtrC family response regulator
MNRKSPPTRPISAPATAPVGRVSSSSFSSAGIVGDALERLAGGVLVLDENLSVAARSPTAEALFGSVLPIGASAPALLCGGHAHRPVAEALAAGKAVEAVIPRPDHTGFIHLRALPLDTNDGRGGFVMLLDKALDEESSVPELFHGMWSRDPRLKRLFRLIERVAADDVTVLVRGETGAGKELVASAIHACSPRRNGPFRAINCAALPAALLESELFGHVRGAFTGAVRDTPGHVQAANGGTLFLDEVAEVPQELQAKLLRVLETRTVLPVGAREPIPVDVRIVSATHRSLRAEVERGRFRADLMYRLRVIPLFLPSLRERPIDVGLLVDKFVEQMNARSRRTIHTIEPAYIHALERFPFYGNVRELKNILAYSFAVGDGDRLTVEHLPQEVLDEGLNARDVLAPPPDRDRDRHPPSSRGAPPDASLDTAESRRIREALARATGKKAQAAKLLGMSRVTLWRRMQALGLADDELVRQLSFLSPPEAPAASARADESTRSRSAKSVDSPVRHATIPSGRTSVAPPARRPNISWNAPAEVGSTTTDTREMPKRSEMSSTATDHR